MSRTTGLRTLLAAIRRRRGWAFVCAIAAIAVTAWLAATVEPVYRATMVMRLEGMTVRAEAGNPSVSDVARNELDERRQRALSAIGSGRLELVARDSVIEHPGGALPLMSIGFEARSLDRDARAAEQRLRAFSDALIADAAAPLAPPVAPSEMDAARAAIAVAENQVRKLRVDIEAFQSEYAAGLPELGASSRDAIDLAIGERDALEQEIALLEARRLELDRGLHAIERDASAARGGSALDAGAEFEALQVRWAVLRGRYSAEHPEALALQAEVSRMREAGRAAYDAIAVELREAREHLAGLERVLPIDHPDVVRQAHHVSSLESRAVQARLPDLTTGDRDSIESLARERRNIEPRLADLKEARAALESRIAEHELLAAQAPSLARQLESLESALLTAEATRDDAIGQHQALQSVLDTWRSVRRGELTVVRGPETSQLAASRPEVIAAAGLAAGLLLVLIVVAIVDRADLRVTGPDSIARIQGSAPLAEIPVLA